MKYLFDSMKITVHKFSIKILPKKVLLSFYMVMTAIFRMFGYITDITDLRRGRNLCAIIVEPFFISFLQGFEGNYMR